MNQDGQDSLDRAVAALEAGSAVVFPTDTVYGLGVAVHFAESPQVIYDIKQRDAGKPIAWLVGGVDALDVYGKNVSSRARELAEAHWPGALTIIVEASDAVPVAFRSSAGTIGLRMPNNARALQLIAKTGPLATSSANLQGGPDPRSADAVSPDLLTKVAVIIDDGQMGSGVASTVLDCTRGGVTVLRQGDVNL